MSEFGTLLKYLRKKARMTQEQLEQRSNVSVSTIRRWENGKGTEPRLATVKQLADALPITPEEHRQLLSLAVDVEPPEPKDDAKWFADLVRARWRDEEDQRGILDPQPLPVRWQQAPEHLTDRWESPVPLEGEIVDVYRRIPSGRLVVLGRAGSGKTVLTLRFLLDFIDARKSTEPVPVIFSLSSWDPTAQALRPWLVDQLLRDYPGLTTNVATALVGANRILPVLDGFDEIAHGLHRTALEALNSSSLRLVLTSRREEYEQAGQVLARSAGVELVDLAPADVADYLRRSTQQQWDPVLDGPLAEVLRTPLMVALAGTVHRDDPTALRNGFPTAKALEEHLLDSFVPTVYRPQPGQRTWDPDRVRHWLGHLARHLHRLGTRNLAWWQLGDSLRDSTRILLVVAVGTLATTLFDWLIATPSYAIESGASGVRHAFQEGVLMGPPVGIAFGLVYGLMARRSPVRPSRVRVRLFGGGRRDGLLLKCAGRFGAGVLGGFVLGLGYSAAASFLRGVWYGFPGTDAVITVTLINTVVIGLVFALAAGSVLGLTAALESPLDVTTAANPVSLLETNRTIVVRQAVVLALMLMVAIGVLGVVVVNALQGLLGELVWSPLGGLVIGVIGGLTGAVSYTAGFTAWGQWVLLARFWLPLTGRLPWEMIEFLDDAYHRGVLRKAGAVYQFRHARLQDHLAR